MNDKKVIKTVTRFGGIARLPQKDMKFKNPITIKTRKDALAIISLITKCDGWVCDLDEILAALKKYIKKKKTIKIIF